MTSETASLPSPAQDRIRSRRLERIAALAGTGAKVGWNYLHHYGRAALTQSPPDREALDRLNAEDVYDTFSKLKGGPLKVAQMLSIDRNLLPAGYSEVFSQAQYSAPPLSYPLVVRSFQREFGRLPTDLFDTFSAEAVSGASIGQVHRASRGSRQFAVKVQYPGVADSLRSDLAVVKPIALRLFGLREQDVATYFAEVEERLLEETDYTLELQSAVELSAASAHLPGLRFPGYHPDLSTRRILTMDWCDGIPLDRFADGDAPQCVRDLIGQTLWDFYHHQIHALLVFHADPHPGNFLVDGHHLVVLDFGCTKRLDPDFYRLHFRFLHPEVSESREALVAALEALNILLPGDPADDRQSLTDLCARSIRLLARPFHEGHFDFGRAGFLEELYALGEENRGNRTLRGLQGPRGSAHGLYVNRAYFGLYSLLARLRACVRTSLPTSLAA